MLACLPCGPMTLWSTPAERPMKTSLVPPALVVQQKEQQIDLQKLNDPALTLLSPDIQSAEATVPSTSTNNKYAKQWQHM